MRSLLTLLLALLLCVSAQAADRKLAWNYGQTGVTFNIYEKVDGKWSSLGSTTEKEFWLRDIQPGEHTYTVTVSNSDAESIETKPVTLPAAVDGLRVVGTLFLEIK